MRTTDLRGQQFGRLFVVSDTGKRLKGGFIIWFCHCKCGKSAEVPTHSLKDGNTRSCGCLHSEVAKKTASKNFSTHRKSKERLYKVWAEMKARCLNSNNNVYRYYGARGIRVCEIWENNYLKFRKWAINNGYKEGLTIDRIDAKGNYEPSNCQWITRSENVIKAWNDRRALEQYD